MTTSNNKLEIINLRKSRASDPSQQTDEFPSKRQLSHSKQISFAAKGVISHRKHEASTLNHITAEDNSVTAEDNSVAAEGILNYNRRQAQPQQIVNVRTASDDDPSGSQR